MTKTTALDEMTVIDADNDLLVAVDVSDTSMAVSGTSKKLKIATLLAEVSGGSGSPSSQSADYTFVSGDANTTISHPSTDTTPRKWTIPANASVPFAVGTKLTIVVDPLSGSITLSINSDVMSLAGTGVVSSVLITNGVVVAEKVSTTRWVLTGDGVDCSIVPGAVLQLKADSEVYSTGTTPAVVDGSIETIGDATVWAVDATQATGSKKPLLKTVSPYNVVRFDGSDDCMRTGAFSLPQPFTVYAVAKIAGDSTRLYDGNTVNEAFMTQTQGATRTRSIYAGSGPVCESEGSSVPDVLCAIFNGASSLVESGLRAKVTGNPGTGYWTAGCLIGGAGNETGGFFASADLYEFVAFPGSHTFAQRNQMRRYFASRWGDKPYLNFIGDSLTAGTGASAGEDYPTQLMALLPGGATDYSSVNGGVGGRTAATWSSMYLSDVGHYSSALRKVVCPYWAGTNDIIAGASAATVYSNLQTFWAGVKSQGVKVIATTVIARGNFDSGQEVIRKALNEKIRSDPSLYDGLCDVGALPQFDATADCSNGSYYNADTVHLVAGGYAVVAATMKPVVESVLQQSFPSLSS